MERFAERWLVRRGLTPLLSNYHCRAGELDLVMQDCHQLAVIEVKYRGRRAMVSGAESVTHAKQRRIALATLNMLQRYPVYAEQPVRFDLLSVTDQADGLNVEWIRDAFRPAL